MRSSVSLFIYHFFCFVPRYKDGREIQAGENVTLQAEGTMRRLIIRSAETLDSGSYTCQAGNNGVQFTVHIRGRRHLLEHLSGLNKTF